MSSDQAVTPGQFIGGYMKTVSFADSKTGKFEGITRAETLRASDDEQMFKLANMKPEDVEYHYRAVGSLSIIGIGAMTTEDRAEIVRWLRGQADSIESQGEKYAERYRARFLKISKNSDLPFRNGRIYAECGASVSR